MTRTGRRPGASGSRDKILAVARSHFARDGYDGATIRGIATSARVDPALVMHFFGSKEHLFVEALRFPRDPADFVPRLVGPGVSGLGERLSRFFLETWEGPEGAQLIALMRSVATNEKAAQMTRQFVQSEILGRMSAALGEEVPKRQLALATSHLIGIAFLRYLVRLEPIASADRAVLARELGPVIQRYFTRPRTRRASTT